MGCEDGLEVAFDCEGDLVLDDFVARHVERERHARDDEAADAVFRGWNGPDENAEIVEAQRFLVAVETPVGEVVYPGPGAPLAVGALFGRADVDAHAVQEDGGVDVGDEMSDRRALGVLDRRSDDGR